MINLKNTYKKTFLFITFIFLLFENTKVNANENKSNDWFYWGLYFDEILISNGIYSVTLNPVFGYRISERLLSGPVLKYHYYKTSNFNAHDYGIGILLDYTFLKKIHDKLPIALFGQSSYEYYNLDKYNDYPDREWINLFWIGGGIRQYFGNNNSASFILSYNLKKGERMPSNPAFKILFIF
jgi:hypothetical protein